MVSYRSARHRVECPLVVSRTMRPHPSPSSPSALGSKWCPMKWQRNWTPWWPSSFTTLTQSAITKVSVVPFPCFHSWDSHSNYSGQLCTDTAIALFQSFLEVGHTGYTCIKPVKPVLLICTFYADIWASHPPNPRLFQRPIYPLQALQLSWCNSYDVIPFPHELIFLCIPSRHFRDIFSTFCGKRWLLEIHSSLTPLKNKLTNNCLQFQDFNTPAVIRQTCAAYMASYVARAKFVSLR